MPLVLRRRFGLLGIILSLVRVRWRFGLLGNIILWTGFFASTAQQERWLDADFLFSCPGLKRGQELIPSQPGFVARFASWQPKYMRDSLTWSRHFRKLFDEENLYEKVHDCPGVVFEVWMNTLLAVETDRGMESARLTYSSIINTSTSLLKMGAEFRAQRDSIVHKVPLNISPEISRSTVR